MIQMDPSDPANYYALTKIYEDNGNYEQAEATLLKRRKRVPTMFGVHAAGVVLQPPGQVRQDHGGAQSAGDQRFPRTPRATTRLPSTTGQDVQGQVAEGRDPRTTSQGLDAADKALRIKPDYLEAIGLQRPVAAQRRHGKGPQKYQELMDEATA